MEKGEIDQKVAELSRSGSNPALRGVLFAQMYMKIGKNTIIRIIRMIIFEAKIITFRI